LSRKKSALMMKQNSFTQSMCGATKITWLQYATDTACIALNNLGWGKDRIAAFVAEWGKVYDQFHEALEKTDETDYYRAMFDARVKPISNETEFRPFERRYEFLPEMKY